MPDTWLSLANFLGAITFGLGIGQTMSRHWWLGGLLAGAGLVASATSWWVICARDRRRMAEARKVWAQIDDAKRRKDTANG